MFCIKHLQDHKIGKSASMAKKKDFYVHDIRSIDISYSTTTLPPPQQHRHKHSGRREKHKKNMKCLIRSENGYYT